MIYYVEDDPNIRDLVVYTLHQSGLAASGFSTGAELMAALVSPLPALILLDIMLPGEDGISLLRRLRMDVDTQHIPVMMISARGAEYDKVIGLDAGADDYLVKPFGMMELVARVRALLRRGTDRAQEDKRLSQAGLCLDIGKHTVAVDGLPIALTFKEFELLRVLMENKGIVLTREQLLEKVWGYDFAGGSRTVDVHVQTLRQKLGTAGTQVETVRGVGYRFGE